ncbi:hypothetical protein [uncultured Mycobacterium sp.]|uniref:hypothetical protein n=1 Tax=uncultured Mycobacterium sp. TaxID=171292 RepID=UPI0035CA1B68
MAKKDPSAAVLGMLSTYGSQTRPTAHNAPAPEPAPATDPLTDPPARTAPQADSVSAPPSRSSPPGPISAPATAASVGDDIPEAAPRTLRLRATTAAKLREAWVQAKRDDVFLTAQDFASNLIEEALAARKRRTSSARSA